MHSRWSQRIFCILCLGFIVLVSGLRLASIDWKARLSTDMLELIPDQSVSPELELGRSVLTDQFSNRVMVAIFDVNHPEAVERYVEMLLSSPLIESVVDLTDTDHYEAVGRYVFEHRFELLFPHWLSRQYAEGVYRSDAFAAKVPDLLDHALDDPGFTAFEGLVTSDPLLLLANAMESFQSTATSLSAPESSHLLELSLSVSTLQPEGQVPVFELLDQAKVAAQQTDAHIRIIDTGAHRYAAQTEQAMRAEVKWLNVSTFLSVFLICLLFCRRIFMVLHVFIILLISLLSGLALLLLMFDHVHIFALIFGCVLCGVIVDYGLHAYLHDLGQAKRSIRTFLKPFLISCGSTVIGFSILFFSELPVLRQMGMLVVCGLFMAIIVTLVYIFGFLSVPPAVQPVTRQWPYPNQWRWVVVLIGGFALVVLPFVHWADDIRNLKYPLPALDAVDAEVRNLQGAERAVILTVGEDYATSRKNLEDLHKWLNDQGVASGQIASAADWVPTLEAYTVAEDFMNSNPQFADQVLSALDENGFEASAFAPFEADWNEWVNRESEATVALRYEGMVQDFSENLGMGLAQMLGRSDRLYWWVSLIDEAVMPESLPHTLQSLRLSQVERMSNVLEEYRERTLELSLIAGFAMYLVLVTTFRLKAGSLIFLVPLIAVTTATSGLYLLFGALGLFHLVGLFLGACLVLDYAVFSWIGLDRDGRLPFSVWISSFTTMASFFILGWSQIPAIHALGVTVFSVALAGISICYLMMPSCVIGRRERHAH